MCLLSIKCSIFSKLSQKNPRLTQSGLHGVDDVSEAVGVQDEGAAAAVEARVHAEHGVVQRLPNSQQVCEHLLHTVRLKSKARSYLRVDAEVGHRGELSEERLDVGLNSALDVPVQLVGLWVGVQQTESDLVT